MWLLKSCRKLPKHEVKLRDLSASSDFQISANWFASGFQVQLKVVLIGIFIKFYELV